jgi:hypothetical protein
MALTANLLPAQITPYPAPIDATTMMSEGQVLTATGYANNRNSGQLDIGGTLGVAQPVSGAGRTEMIWSIDIPSCDYSSGDETYRLFLFGSNDAAFGNGNVENLAAHDLAAASAGRVVPTILGASPAGKRIQILVSNLMHGIQYRYLRTYAVVGGTTPSITLTSWISRIGIRI